MPQVVVAAVVAVAQFAGASIAATVGAAGVAGSLTAAGAATLAGAGITGAAAVAVNIAGVVVAAGVTAAGISLLNKKPKTATADISSQFSQDMSAVGNRKIIMGRTIVAGTRMTANMLCGNNKNRLAYIVTTSHCGLSGSITGIKWGDDILSFDGSGKCTAPSKYVGKIWLYQKNGSWTQSAIQIPIGAGHAFPDNSHSQPSDWTTDHRALGCQVAMLVFNQSDAVWSDNNYTPLFIVEATDVVLIDPRTGTTATTWAQRKNPAVWFYNYAQKIYSSNGAHIAGLGFSAAEIDVNVINGWANLCDANNWSVAGEIDTAPENGENVLAEIAKAGGASINYIGGKLSVTYSSLKTAVATITEKDLRALPKIESNIPTSYKANRVVTKYISEATSWKIVKSAPIYSQDFIDADNGRYRTDELEIMYNGGGETQAGQIGAYGLVNAREPRKITLPLKPHMLYSFGVGNCINVDLPELGLYNYKIFITKRTKYTDGNVDAEGITETDSKHPWALGKTAVSPNYTQQAEIDNNYAPIPSLSAWTATAVNLVVSGQSKPIIRVTGASDWTNAKNIVIKYRLASGGDWLGIYELPKEATSFEISAVTQNTSYIVAIAYKNQAGVIGAFLELPSVTTGTETAGSATVATNQITSLAKTLDTSTRTIASGINILSHTFTSIGKTTLVNIEVQGDLNSNTSSAISLYLDGVLVRVLPSFEKVLTATSTYRTAFDLTNFENIIPTSGTRVLTLKASTSLIINRAQIVTTEYRDN